MAPRRLGVGLVYVPELAPVVAAGPGTVAVVELEIQTFWEKLADGVRGWRYRANEPLLERVAGEVRERGQATLLHGVGQPVGGATGDPVDHVPLLRHAVEMFDPAWVSEHLSVNRVTAAGGPEELGFLFPPRQSPGGVRVAAANVRRYGRALARPVAFETGVSYLRPDPGEIPEGPFFAAVAERADCGILLDLHNLWCNEVNGRAAVEDVLTALPLERVWEVHLAGGSDLDGYRLDAHDGVVPEPLLELAARVLPRLPALGALNFEILAEHVAAVGLDAVAAQLDALRDLWRLLPPAVVTASAAEPPPPWEPGPADPADPADLAEVQRWERGLATNLRTPPCAAAAVDPGFALYGQLVRDFRRGNLARVLRYTLSALLSSLGRQETYGLLDVYEAQTPPDAYPAVEAHTFAEFLRSRPQVLARVPLLGEVLAFEHALVRATVFGESSDLDWSVDPTELLARLEAGGAPGELVPVHSRMRIQASA